MPRMRTIRPEITQDERLVALPCHCRLLLLVLPCIADREGRLEDRPLKIKTFAFPYEEVNVDESLEALYLAGFITRYVIDGSAYIQINHWKRDQTQINVREAKSRIPAMGTPGSALRPHSLENEPQLELHDAFTVSSQCLHSEKISDIRGLKDVNVLTSKTTSKTTSTPREDKKPTASSAKPEKRKPDDLSAAVSRLQKSFDERLEGKFGAHSFPWAVAGAKFRSLLAKKIPEEEIIRRIENYFASTDKWIEDNGYSVTIFDQKFNALAGGPLGRNGNYAGNAGGSANPGYAAPIPGKYAALTQRTAKGP